MFSVDVVHIPPLKRHFLHTQSVPSCRTASPTLSSLLSNHTANTQSISRRHAWRKTGSALAIAKPWDRYIEDKGEQVSTPRTIGMLVNKPLVWRGLKTPSGKEGWLNSDGYKSVSEACRTGDLWHRVCGFLLTFNINKFCHFLGSPVAVLTWTLSVL